MDMDMDIPLPEELELLEANSHYYEEPELESPSPDPSPPKSPPSENLDFYGPKRPRDSVETEPLAEENKRIKPTEIEEEEEEDWLRYSPPKETNVAAAIEKDEEVYLSRYVSVINGDCFPVTAPSGGERVYAKISRAQRDEGLKKLNLKERSNGLISDPVKVLLQRVEQQAFAKALQASSEHESDITLLDTPIVHEQLWVDKYAPSSFTELLSDEQTNREVLLWLKQWDSCVFGSEIRSTSDEVLSALRRHSTQHQKSFDSNISRKSRGHGWSNGSYRPTDNVDHGTNNLKGMQDLWKKKSRLTGPPEHKILLLCGPPGLGKTTLAHVAAKHCGYRVVEVNASDDRSSSTIEAKILDVVQMNSVTADARPKCLVIDEIDGALGDVKGAVEVILKMVSAERKSDFGKENNANKKGRKTASLSRPVICICNDLYAPALRPLRQVAKVHIFVQPTVSRIVSRLKYICNKEGMKTSSIALTALAEFTECDIRSCLNTLQFLNKKNEALNVMEISSQVVGRKDVSKSAFDIWKEIFQKQKMKRDRKSNSSSGNSYGEFDFLHSLISSRGDYNVIMDGIHENLLQLQYHDPVMQKTVICLNSLGISDLMQHYVMQTQKMSLQVYQPSFAITLHRIVAQVQKPTIEWPKSYQRYRTMLMEKTDILRSWHQKITPYISRHLSMKSCTEDLISPLLHILSPPKLRPVAFHLLSETERNNFAQLVNVMVSYSITYKNMKSDSLSSSLGHEAVLDASALSFVPPLDEFIAYKDYKSDHHVLVLAMKQVLLHEVEKQKILHVSAGKSVRRTDGCSNGDQDFIGKAASGAKLAKTIGENAGAGSKNFENVKNISNSRQGNPSTSMVSSSFVSSRSAIAGAKQKSTADTQKPRSGFNFFERFRKPSSKGSQDSDIAGVKEVTSERDLRPLLFKFNEGFTNAVKRPVRIREFLLL